MPAIIDLINQHFGKWTVLSKGPSGERSLRWLCRCECGVKSMVQGCHLRNGKSQSCRQCVEWGPRDGIPISSRQWAHIKANAKKRAIEFRVTRELVYNIFKRQGGKCALTGISLRFDSARQKSYGTASLDRIDSSKGYIPNNIQWVHKDINVMKGSMSEDQLKHYCSLILSNNRR